MYNKEDLIKLLKETEGAAYIVDMECFRKNVHNFLAAFRHYYTNTNLGYSYKTNYLPALNIEARELGLYAEVVSGMEYEIAVECGNSMDRIIFNGPLKTESELEIALLGNSLVNIDSLEEVAKIINICNRYPDRYFGVGLRCQFQIVDGWESRFGLNESDGQLQRAFEEIDRLSNCSINGLHCHFSKDRSAASYAKRTKEMLKLVTRYFPDRPPKYLDIGGGFFGPMSGALRRQFGNTPTYEDYAAEIAPLVAEKFGKDGRTELILEPGVGVMGDVMQFACTVVAVKQLPDRAVAVTTGSYQNLRPHSHPFNLPIRIYSDHQCQPISNNCRVDIVGYTCMEDDVLYKGCPDSLNVNDTIIFENVGAYSCVFKPPFIRTTPPIVIHNENGSWSYLRHRETVHELMKPYVY